MNKEVRFIIEDLLPLYNEGLLSEETTKWLEKQMAENEEYKRLAETSQKPLEKENIPNPVDQELMFKRINRKLSIYQILFVALSFFLAIKTSVLNNSFGFILWYAILGFVIFLFYSDIKIVFLFSFVPIFIWAMTNHISEYYTGAYTDVSFITMIGQTLSMAIIVSVLHLLFAVLGSIVGWLAKKIWTKEG